MLQILVNAAIYAAEISLIASGLALSYSILRFANFAHVQYAIVGGYLSYAIAAAGIPLPLAILELGHGNAQACLRIRIATKSRPNRRQMIK